jgi:hypothetical protein
MGMGKGVCFVLCDADSVFMFLGHSSSKFTVHNAMSYYSMKQSVDLYHVTACYSPRGKSLAGSPYHKFAAVEKALGKISQLSIMGCVVTKDTFSARVVLRTKDQQKLWMNDQERKRGIVQGGATAIIRGYNSSQ